MIFAKKLTAACYIIIYGCLFSHTGLASDEKPTNFQFSNSCASGLQEEFNRGVRLLHSFEYPETTKIFAGILEKDPNCAMAYWGTAMSIWHPLWAPPSKADLQAGAKVLEKAKELKATQRERDYLDALSVFFSSTDINTNDSRAREHSKKMKAIHEKYGSEDVDASVFYALSLLGSADPRDKTYKNQFYSGKILKKIQISNPTHPGVLHYTIHSFDFPGLAHYALAHAKKYASVAKDSAHAQHMPAHIFTRLGLWEMSLASNHDAIKSAADYTRSAHLKTHYDEGLHSMDYLMYAMLQTGRDKEARDLLEKLTSINGIKNFKVAFAYACSYARYTLERRAWREASQIRLVVQDFPWEKFPWAESIHYFARGIGAARSGQIEQAKAELAVIKRLQKALTGTEYLYWHVEAQVQANVVTSWIMLKEGKTEEALELANDAADREDAVDKAPLTPGEVIPARELYGDMLFEVGKYEEALQQYQIVLEGSPNRLNALRGVALSAKAAGKSGIARDYTGIIRNQTKFGDRKISGL